MEEIEKQKIKINQLRQQITAEDKLFVEQLDRILSGKSWEIERFVKYINKKRGLTNLESEYLFRLLKIEKLNNKDMSKSDVLAILLLCHKHFVYYVIDKIKIPACIRYDEVLAQVESGLRKAIDGYDVEQEAKFLTYANVVMKNEALMLMRLKRLSVISLEEKVSPDDKNDITYSQVLAYDDEYIQDFAERDLAERCWRFLGYFNITTQVCIMAHLGKYTKKYTCTEVAQMLNISRSVVSKRITFAIKEMQLMAQDPRYIIDKKYQLFRYREYKSQVQETYHLVDKQEFFDILYNKSETNLLLR